MNLTDIARLPSDVNEGDLVRIHFSGTRNTLVGYIWYTSQAEYEEHEGTSDGQQEVLLTYQHGVTKMRDLGAPNEMLTFLEKAMQPTEYNRIVATEHANVYISPIPPDAMDETPSGELLDFDLENIVQLFGIDTQRKVFLTVPIVGYDVLERAP